MVCGTDTSCAFDRPPITTMIREREGSIRVDEQSRPRPRPLIRRRPRDFRHGGDIGEAIAAPKSHLPVGNTGDAEAILDRACQFGAVREPSRRGAEPPRTARYSWGGRKVGPCGPRLIPVASASPPKPSEVAEVTMSAALFLRSEAGICHQVFPHRAWERPCCHATKRPGNSAFNSGPSATEWDRCCAIAALACSGSCARKASTIAA